MKLLTSIGVFLIFSLFKTLICVESPTFLRIENILTTRRLEKHVEVLYKFGSGHKSLIVQVLKSSEAEQTLSEEASYFNHTLINWAIKKMKQDKIIDPIFDIWHDFKDHEGIDVYNDQVFLRDFGMLLFIFYNAVLNEVTVKQLERVNPNEIIDLYERIADLPISELLNVLDQILEEFLLIMHDYGPNPNESIIDWLKENWWVPPTIIAGVIVAIIMPRLISNDSKM